MACTSANRSSHHLSAGFAGFRRAELPLAAKNIPIVEVRRAEIVPNALAAPESHSMQSQETVYDLRSVPKARPLNQ